MRAGRRGGAALIGPGSFMAFVFMALLLLAVVAAPAAHAGAPVLTVTSPGNGTTISAAPLTVDGSASASSPGGLITGSLQLVISSDAGHPSYSQTVPDWCDRPACSFTLTVGSGLAYNGQYDLSAQATETDPPLGSTHPADWSGSFSVAVPPVPPSGLAAQPAADGTSIALSWQPNPEPDIIGYEISRTPAGPGSWPVEVSGTSFVDSQVVPGTDYTYEVSAVRPGAASGSTLTSTPSAVSATPAVPAGGAGSASGGAAGSGSAGSGSAGSGSAGSASGSAAGSASGSGARPGTNGKASSGPARSPSVSSPDNLVDRAAKPEAASASSAGDRSGPRPVPSTLAPPADGVAPGSDNPAVAPFTSGPGGPIRAEAGGPVTITVETTTENHDALVRDASAAALAALLLAVAAHLFWLRRRLG